MTDSPIARPLPFALAFATAALLAACGGGEREGEGQRAGDR